MIEGRVLFVNTSCQLAAADIGGGRALVFELPADAQIDIGDRLERLVSRYQKVKTNCLNATKHNEIHIQVLASPMPVGVARFVVEPGCLEGNLSRVA